MFASGTGLLCMPNLSDLGTDTDCGCAARAPQKNGGWSIGANAMRSVLAFGLLIASVLLPTLQGCITPNRDMSPFVPAKVWTHAFRRSSKTRPLATTIHPSSAGADLRRPKRIARNRATESHRRGATSVHSPDLNPDRQVFAKFKHLLRKAAAREAETICVTIGEIRAFTSNAPPISETQAMPNPKSIML
jgi:hypothetical protein